MTSAAEQLAQNFSWSTFSKARDLQQRLLFTLGALIVFRFGIFIPLPGIDVEVYRAAAADQPVRRRCAGEPVDLLAVDFPVHLRFDHHAADAHGDP